MNQRAPSPTPDRARLPKRTRSTTAKAKRIEAAELEARATRLLQMAAVLHGEALNLSSKAALLRLQSDPL